MKFVDDCTGSMPEIPRIAFSNRSRSLTIRSMRGFSSSYSPQATSAAVAEKKFKLYGSVAL